MIQEDYVSFETAKLLKEKGFNWNTDKQYDLDKIVGEYNITDRSRNPERYLDAPTLQMAMKWLREAHNIHIEVEVLKPYGTDGHHSIPKESVSYYAVMQHINKWNSDLEEFKHVGISSKNTYEEACEAGIKYCLENLI